MAESIKQRISALANNRDAAELRKLFEAIYADIGLSKTGSATYDAANLIDAAGVTTTVTVAGAQVGDFAIASLGVDTAGITVTAWVSAANTVSVRLQNESGGALDLASTTIRVRVIPATPNLTA